MTAPLPPLFWGLGAAGLLVLLLAAMGMVLADPARKQLQLRLGHVARLHGRRSTAPAVRGPAVARRAAPVQAGLARWCALLGFDPTAGAQHPAPWRAVLVLAALLGVLAGWQGRNFLGPPGLLLGPACFVALSRAAFAHGRSRYRARLYAQIPDVLGVIVRAVRAGIPVVESVRAVAREVPSPTREEFGQLAAEIGVGMPLDRCLWALAHRSGTAEYAFFAVALTLQAQTGGSLAETLDNLADVVRKRIAIRARGLALAAEARTSAAVLTGVPIVTGLGLAVINPEYMEVLFTDPRGHNLLVASAALLGFGTLTIRTLIRRTLA